MFMNMCLHSGCPQCQLVVYMMCLLRSMFSRTGREGGVLASARGTPAMDLIATDLIASDSQQSFAEPISLF